MLVLWLLACESAHRPTVPDPCLEAWAEMRDLQAGLAVPLGDTMKAPSEDVFLSACHALPEAARPCMTMRRRIEDPEGCRARLDAVPIDVRKAVERALTDGVRLDEAPAAH